MKKTKFLIALLLMFSFVPAFAEGSPTGPNSGLGCEPRVTWDGISYIWNKAQQFFSNKKETKTAENSGKVESTTQSKRDSSKKDVSPAKKAKKDAKNKQKETKTIKRKYYPMADQMRVQKVNSKPTGINNLREQIYRSAYHASFK